MAWQFRQYIVDTFCSHSRNQKSKSKEKATSRFTRFIHSYMTKNYLIGGWVGVGQLLVAALRSSVLIIVYLLLNRLKCQI
jgi:hypothetical protein